ncbi:acylphosphatase [Patescibacteria group bacterium]|nr:acylphosphatase [Patescibacteria group bacterium]MBU1890114.1 acylphosphatase [Patescibacteria group bacterium]
MRIYGTVQGVNLRSMVKVKALDLGLTGYVKNNDDDGSVSLEAEEDKEKLEQFIDWLKNLHGSCRVDRIEESWEEATNEHDDFIVKY